MYRLACVYDENLGLSLHMLSRRTEVHAMLNGKKKRRRYFKYLKRLDCSEG